MYWCLKSEHGKSLLALPSWLVYTFKKVKTLRIPLHQSCAGNVVTKAFIPDSLSSNLHKSSI
jgi:hypothetical protein